MDGTESWVKFPFLKVATDVATDSFKVIEKAGRGAEI
jgi:hypothetical protein